MPSQLQIDTCAWEEFKEYAEKSKSLSPATKDADKLVLYDLYKISHCRRRQYRHGFFSPTEGVKWDAWKAFEKKSKDEAMREYIDRVKQLQKQISTK